MRFAVPVFQRRYAWGQAECSQLLADILNAGQQSRIQRHFTGTVVTVAPADSHMLQPIYNIVDGQQRLTTLSILLVSVLSELRARHEMSLFPVVSDTGRAWSESFITDLLTVKTGDGVAPRIELSSPDIEAYSSLVKDGYIDEDSNIRSNYRFFRKEIGRMLDSTEDPADALAELFTGIEKLEVISAEMEHGDSPQLVYESMNSTGKDLTQADLVRNYVLIGLDAGIQKLFYNNYWRKIEQQFGESYETDFDHFLRSFLTIRRKEIPKVRAVYHTFKQYYVESGDNTKALLDEMLRYANYYAYMRYGSDSLNTLEDVKLNHIFGNVIRRMSGSDIVFPIIFKLFSDYKESVGSLSYDQLLKLIGYIESYYVRRHFYGLVAGNMNLRFEKIMQTVDEDDYYDSFMSLIATGSRANSKLFPNNDDFIESLTTKPVYSSPVLKYLLSRIENAAHKTPVDYVGDKRVSIEHVLPQNPNLSPDWQEMLGEAWVEEHQSLVHLLGNLTLTERNSEYSDRDYSEKLVLIDRDGNRIGLRSSTAPNLNIEFVDEKDPASAIWSREQIETRGLRLAQMAAQVFAFPPAAQSAKTSEAKSSRSQYRVRLTDIISAGIIAPGELESTIAKWKGKAVLGENGTITYKDNSYDSPSGAAVALVEYVNSQLPVSERRTTINSDGWDMWGVRQPDNTLKKLKEYRADFLEKVTPSSEE